MGPYTMSWYALKDLMLSMGVFAMGTFEGLSSTERECVSYLDSVGRVPRGSERAHEDQSREKPRRSGF